MNVLSFAPTSVLFIMFLLATKCTKAVTATTNVFLGLMDF